MGFINNNSRVSATVSTAPPTVFKGQNDYCQRPTIGARIEGRGASSFAKRSNHKGALQRTANWVLFNLLHNPKKRGWSSSHSGSQAPQSVLKNSSIQNDSYKDGNASHTRRRMVHVPGFKRRLFPCSNLSRAQAFSPLCFSRPGLSVPGSAVRPVFGTESFYSGDLSCLSSPSAAGYQNPAISGRLVNLCSLSRAGGQEHRGGTSSHSVPGVHSELEEEQPPASTAGEIPGAIFQLQDNGSMSHSPENRQPGEGVGSLPEGETCDSPQGSEAGRTDGGSISGDSFRPTEDTADTEMAQFFSSSSKKGQKNKTVGDKGLHAGLTSLEGQGLSQQGLFTGQSSSPKISDNNRCITDGLGSRLGRQISKGQMGSPVVIRTHKCARTASRSSRSQGSFTIFSPQACASEDRQYLSGLPHKSPRRDEIITLSPGGNEPADMDMAKAVLTESNPHPGGDKQSSRHFVQNGASPRGVAVAHRGSNPNLDPIRDRSGRSLCFQGDDPLPGMVLPHGTGGQFGPGCSVTRLAEKLIICFSPLSSDFSGPPEDQGGSLHSSTCCSTLAGKTMVPGPSSAGSGSSVATSITGRSPIPNRRADLASKPDGTSSMGMASAESIPQQLDETVRETLNNARAPSTRANYSIKWRIFAEWCLGLNVDPITCSVPLVLRFLQAQLDQGKAASTIRVYAASISASHRGVDGQPLGRHPLVSQFLCPNRTLRVPNWDLPLVLDSLTKPPYEPMADADFKAWSLKTAFLLAICSAKRVGELCALSISEDCLRWRPDGTGVTLWPNPAFLPKVLNSQFRNQVLEVVQFQPPSQADQQNLLTLCPVRALRTYVNLTQTLRKSHSQLFVCYGKARLGCPLSKQRLSHWLVEVISQAYTGSGLPVPLGIRAHSTRSVATSWAALKGVSVGEICAAASWSTPCTFAKFYRVDVTSTAPVGNAVLMSVAQRGLNSSESIVPRDPVDMSHPIRP